MIPKKTVIAFLTFTALLLTCVLALQQFNFSPSSAQAGPGIRAGRYVVATTLFDETRSAFWVVNVENQSLSVFDFLPTGGFILRDRVNLNLVFRPQVPTQTDPRLNPGTTGQTIRPPQINDQTGIIKKKTEPNIIKQKTNPSGI
jgi:hypothetical protein